MDIDLNRLYWLITHRPDRIKKAVEGTGYLAKTVLGQSARSCSTTKVTSVCSLQSRR